MTAEFVISLGSEAIKIALILALPLLGVGLIVGLIVAVIQATTQIQEMTLSFVPKIVSVLLALLAASPWMLSKISVFTSHIIMDIPNIIK
jgi:flagellar biosynthetic protein FliQ